MNKFQNPENTIKEWLLLVALLLLLNAVICWFRPLNVYVFDTFTLYLPFAQQTSWPPSIAGASSEDKFYIVLGVLPLLVAKILSSIFGDFAYTALIVLFVSISFYYFRRATITENSLIGFLLFLVVTELFSLEIKQLIAGKMTLEGPLFLRFPNTLVSLCWVVSFFVYFKEKNDIALCILGVTGLLVNIYVGIPLALGMFLILFARNKYWHFGVSFLLISVIFAAHFVQVWVMENSVFHQYLGLKYTERSWLIILYLALALTFSLLRQYWISLVFLCLMIGRAMPFIIGYSAQPFHWERDFGIPALMIYTFNRYYPSLSRIFLTRVCVLVFSAYIILLGTTIYQRSDLEPHVLVGDTYVFGRDGFGWTIDGFGYISAPPFSLDSPRDNLLKWGALDCSVDTNSRVSVFLKSKYGYYSVYYLMNLYTNRQVILSEEDIYFFRSVSEYCFRNLGTSSFGERLNRLRRSFSNSTP
jgi:hypothetical protein